MVAPVSRIIGRIQRAAGPTLVVVGGIHGNEPAGVHALRRVFARLGEEPELVRGTFLGVVGNVQALAAGRRYLDSDLNRHWSDQEVDWLRHGSLHFAEDRERLALLEIVDELPRDTVWVDLHTTSGAAAPFSVIPEHPQNRPLARALGLPAVLGLSENIGGSLVGWLSSHGPVGIGVEGGLNEAPEAVDHLESVVWLALDQVGCLVGGVDLEAQRARLSAATSAYPRAVHIVYRHAILDDDEFEMLPGFANFQPVEAGRVVAHDRDGPVRVPMSGYLMLPRYQGQGDDGYFIARDTEL